MVFQGSDVVNYFIYTCNCSELKTNEILNRIINHLTISKYRAE